MRTWQELEKLREKIAELTDYPVFHAASALPEHRPFISLELVRESEVARGLGFLHVDMWVVAGIHEFKEALEAGDRIIEALTADESYSLYHDREYRSFVLDNETGVGLIRHRLVIPSQRR